jgi:hypothetical protein
MLKSRSERQTEALLSHGWGRTSHGKWVKGNRRYTKRAALLKAGMLTLDTPPAKQKPGPTTSDPDKLVSRVNRHDPRIPLREMGRRKKAKPLTRRRAKKRRNRSRSPF